MHDTDNMNRRAEEAQARFRAALIGAFGEALRRSDLPPIAALRLAAVALGSVYREVSDAHTGPDACPCGWHPHPRADMELLCDALMSECRRQPRRDLLTMQVAGTA